MQPDHTPELELKMLRSFSSRPRPHSLVTSTETSQPSLQILLVSLPHVRPSLQTRTRSTCSSLSTSVNHMPGKSCRPYSSSKLLTSSFSEMPPWNRCPCLASLPPSPVLPTVMDMSPCPVIVCSSFTVRKRGNAGPCLIHLRAQTPCQVCRCMC